MNLVLLQPKNYLNPEIDGLRDILKTEKDEDKIKMYNIVIAYLEHRVATGNPL